ncbi:YqeB family protein [Actinoplanes sp. G11-F43]|uniref:YqeB family protein n=1 Tax=Actinoplanes sp. G11-F43 TaxID=3424130 RepID=UPI003D33A12A
MNSPRREVTVLTFSPGTRLLVTAGPATAGILLAVLVPFLARWLDGIGFPVLGVVWRVIAEVDTWWKIAVQAGIFALLGALASVEITRRLTRVTIAADEVLLETGDESVTVPRPVIDFVFMTGDRLIILDPDSRQMFHGEPRAEAAMLERAFTDHGYPWRDGDPFTDLYQPWVPESGELPVAVEAVLSARAVALRKKAGKESAELRASLEKLGYAVRDDGDRQHWRPLVRS